MYEEIKQRVFDANMKLFHNKLITLTWGNASECDRQNGVIAIKPSGIDYEKLTVKDIVVLDFNGNLIDGNLRPSSDTPTHIEVYKAFDNINGITHTHSTYATAFAQAGENIISLGTTHADVFYGSVPCSRILTKEEIETDYEKNTGKVIAETLKTENNIKSMPAILINNHGPFTFGKDANNSVANAIALEEIAKMAYLTKQINPNTKAISKYIKDKHYFRKHGKDAYYGQNNTKD